MSWSEALSARARVSKGAALPAAAAAVGLLLLRLTRSRWGNARQAAADRRLQEALEAVRGKLPALARVASLAEAVAAVGSSSERLTDGVDRLAEVISSAGGELRAALPASGSASAEDEAKAVDEFFQAWGEVGDAAATCGAQLTQASSTLRDAVARLEAQRLRCLEEAAELELALAGAEAEARRTAEPRGFLADLLGGASGRAAAEADAAYAREQLQAQWTLTTASMDRLAKDLEDLREEASKAVSQGVADLRRPAKPVGERLILLRPGQKGGGAPARAKGATGQHVGGLISSMVTAEGRQKLREAEAAEEAIREAANPPPKEDAPMLTPPIEEKVDGEWRIGGVYRHQVLKAGLRRLDEQWPALALLDFPKAGLLDVGRGLLREALFRDMLSGNVRLQSITINDVAAAQRDLEKLSLRQLLRLRVQHIDFTPSGCGADSISTIGGAHEAFLSKMDSRLFELLGRKAAGKFVEGADDVHRFGAEAVLFAAATASLPSPHWWCWWLSDRRRVFLDPARFEASDVFPADGGVLEVADFSKRDKHEPTGRLQWIDWRIRLVNEETLLVAGPLSLANGGSAAVASSGGDAGAGAAANVGPVGAGGTGSGASAAAGASAGGGASGASGTSGLALSADVLRDVRGSLRKVRFNAGGAGAAGEQS